MLKYVNKTHWDTKEAFAAAIDKTGISAESDNVNCRMGSLSIRQRWLQESY